jgi:hypothetical protein
MVLQQDSSLKPGYTTTEFWVQVVTMVLAALTAIFQSDFHGAATHIPEIAGTGALLGNLYYMYARTQLKQRHAELQALRPLPLPASEQK